MSRLETDADTFTRLSLGFDLLESLGICKVEAVNSDASLRAVFQYGPLWRGKPCLWRGGSVVSGQSCSVTCQAPCTGKSAELFCPLGRRWCQLKRVDRKNEDQSSPKVQNM